MFRVRFTSYLSYLHWSDDVGRTINRLLGYCATLTLLIFVMRFTQFRMRNHAQKMDKKAKKKNDKILSTLFPGSLLPLLWVTRSKRSSDKPAVHFSTYWLEDHATHFFTHFEERNPLGCESFCKNEQEEHLNTSFGFEVKKNCTSKLLNFHLKGIYETQP